MPTPTTTPEMRASIVASNNVSVLSRIAAQHAKLKSNGLPAGKDPATQLDVPAITGAQYLAALGANNAVVLDSLVPTT